MKSARIEAGLTQGALGREIGIRGTYVSQIEGGHRIPSDENCLLLAGALGLNPQRILLRAYRERAARGKGSGELFEAAALCQLARDPAIDPALLRTLLDDPRWLEATKAAASMPGRDIPLLIRLAAGMDCRQWQALLKLARQLGHSGA